MSDEVIHPEASSIGKGKKSRGNWFLRMLVSKDGVLSDSITSEQRRSIRFNAINEIRSDLARFNGLSILDQDTKDRLRPAILRHIVRVARIKFRLVERVNSTVMRVGFWLLPIDAILVLFSPGKFGDGVSYGPAFLSSFFALGWICALAAFGGLSYKELSEYLARMQGKQRYWWIGLFFYFSAVYIDPGYPYDPKTAFGVASGFVVFLLIVVSGPWMAIHGLINLYTLSEKRCNALKPDSYIVVGYLQILYFLDEHPHSLRRAPEKRQLLALLEQVASLMQRDLPKPFHSDSLDADVWFQGRTGQMATAVRDLKTWVLAPKSDTESYFTTRIVNDMFSVSTGSWDAVPIDDSKPVQQASRWISFGTLLLRSIVFVVVVLLATHSTKIEPHWVTANYTFLLVGFPILVTLLGRIDPLIAPIISSYKDNVKSFQEIGKKPEH